MHYIASFTFIIYYLLGTNLLLIFSVLFLALMVLFFFIIIGYSSYLKYKQRKHHPSAIGPEVADKKAEVAEKKATENNYKNMYHLMVCCSALSFNIIAPFSFFASYIANSKKVRQMNSMEFFYGAVGQNLSSTYLIQLTFDMWISVLISIGREDSKPYFELKQRISKMTMYSGWYTALFGISAILIGSIGGIFNLEKSSIVMAVIFLVLGLLSVVAYIIKTHWL